MPSAFPRLVGAGLLRYASSQDVSPLWAAIPHACARVALAKCRVVARVGGLLFSPRYHVVLGVKVCAHRVRLRPGGRFLNPDTLRCDVVRRSRAIPPDTDRSTAMSSTHLSLDPSSLLVHDVQGDYRPASADEVLQAAMHVVGQQVRRGAVLSSPQAVRDFLRVKLGTLEHEVFAVLLMDAQNRLIEYLELFRGTVTQTSVYPREVVKEALARNAAAIIFAHNHPLW